MNDSITSFDIQVLNLKIDDTVAAEIGPLRFLAGVTGLEMGTVVNILTLIIVFVFDPLAVILIVGFNTALKVDRGLKDKQKVIEHRILYGEEKPKVPHAKELDDDEVAMQDMDKLDDVLEPWNDNEEITSVGITESDMNRAAEEVMKEIMDESPTFIPPGTTAQEPPNHAYPNPNDIEVIDEEIVKPVLDTDGDNLISKNEYIAYYERGGWRDAHKGLPYYHNPMFDWEKSERWINDPTAVKYWLEFKGGNPTTLQKYRKKN